MRATDAPHISPTCWGEALVESSWLEQTRAFLELTSSNELYRDMVFKLISRLFLENLPGRKCQRFCWRVKTLGRFSHLSVPCPSLPHLSWHSSSSLPTVVRVYPNPLFWHLLFLQMCYVCIYYLSVCSIFLLIRWGRQTIARGAQSFVELSSFFYLAWDMREQEELQADWDGFEFLHLN